MYPYTLGYPFTVPRCCGYTLQVTDFACYGRLRLQPGRCLFTLRLVDYVYVYVVIWVIDFVAVTLRCWLVLLPRFGYYRPTL